MSTPTTDDRSQIKCLRCKDRLEPSGMEPYRHICVACGQHYFVVVQITPVEPKRVPQLEGGGVAECSSRTD